MKGVFGIVGHVDHGKPTLFAAMSLVTESERGIVITSENLAEAFDNLKQENRIPVLNHDNKQLSQIIKEGRSVKLTAPEVVELKQWNFKSGKDNRRERRKQERKLKNK